MSHADAITQLSPTFTGQLLQRDDVGYDDARRVHNGLIDKRPALIARCHGTADVVDAVKLARTLGLEVAVRGGGHNVAGRATVDDGLMIDLASMKGIHVDPRQRTAPRRAACCGRSSIARHRYMDSPRPVASWARRASRGSRSAAGWAG
jgi:hypothetical protein